jgi:hypothetical protein
VALAAAISPKEASGASPLRVLLSSTAGKSSVFAPTENLASTRSTLVKTIPNRRLSTELAEAFYGWRSTACVVRYAMEERHGYQGY